MSGFLPDLPAEIKRHIFNHCKKGDLLNLASCSKECLNQVLPVLWNDVKINWSVVEKSKAVYTCKGLQHLQHTSRLGFVNGNRGGEKNKNGLRGFVFGCVLQNCSPDRLNSLYIEGIICGDALKLASEIAPNIKCLKLRCIYSSVPDPPWHFQHLRYLNVCLCANITDDHIKKIAEVGNLYSLQLDSCKNLTLLSVEYASQITELKEFAFHPYYSEATSQFSRKMNGTIKQLKNLLALRLTENGDVVNDDLFDDYVSASIEYLMLGSTSVTDMGLKSISLLRNLKYLSFFECSITDLGLSYISSLTSLKYLDCNSCEEITMAGLLCISNLKELEYLDFGYIDAITLTEKTLSTLLKHLTSLRYLGMRELNGTDQCLRTVSKLPHLVALDISGWNITDNGLHYIKQLRNLKYFEADSTDGELPTGVTNEAMEKLGLDQLNYASCYRHYWQKLYFVYGV